MNGFNSHGDYKVSLILRKFRADGAKSSKPKDQTLGFFFVNFAFFLPSFWGVELLKFSE